VRVDCGYDGEADSDPQSDLVPRQPAEAAGLIVSEHMQSGRRRWKELGGHVGAGRIRYRESVAQGLQSAPEAFIRPAQGRNFGKQLVKLD